MAPVDTIAVHTARYAALQAAVDAAVERAWRQVPDLSDEAAEAWLATVRPVVAGGQQQAAALMAAYLISLIGEMSGGRVDPGAVDPAAVTGAALRNGTPPDVVYLRPIVQARTILANGGAGSEAFSAGQRRALSLARTDMQLARTHQARAVLAGQERIVGYRRVLTGSENCDLCTAAARRRYHVRDLMPIHPGCDCGVAPIIGTEDPGTTLNDDHLGDPDVADAVYTHGEYGPTLENADHDHLSERAALGRS